MGLGEQAVLQLEGDADVWAMHCFPIGPPIEWFTYSQELKAKYIPSNTLDLVKPEWEELCLKEGKCVIECNSCFRHLLSKLDLHQPMPAKILADAYGYKIDKRNKGVYKD